MEPNKLFPRTFDEYIGQEALKARLNVHIQGALLGKKMLPHILLAGPSGYGKTALGHLISQTLADNMEKITVPMDDRQFYNLMSRYASGELRILFIDEIHRAGKAQQESLLTLLSDKMFQDKRGRKLYIANLTVIGATTELGKLVKPLQERFIVQPDFVDYTNVDMVKILGNMCARLDLELESDTLKGLAVAALGIPRRCEIFVKAAEDLALGLGRPPTAEEVLKLCGIAPDGLTTQHMQYLDTLDKNGQRAGMSVLSTRLQVSQSVIMELERVLFDRQLVELTPSGRELTLAGFRRLHPEQKITRQRQAE